MKRFTTLFMLCVLAIAAFRPQLALAGNNQSNDQIRAVTCNALKGTGNLGVEFYFTFDPCYEEAGNNKLMLYLASASNGFATVEVVDKGFKQKVVLKANDVTPVELGPGNGQAFSKPINGGIPPEMVYPGAAVHVTATVPIVIYAVTRFAYTSDSFLALPVQTLGKDYIVASMADMTWMFSGYSLPSETAIVAPYDNTTVTFKLGGTSVTRTSGGMRPGQTKTFTMNKGDVWVVGNDANSKEGDMSGSTVHASKPVAVISGNQCANIPTVTQWCDFISEQEIPTQTWGRYLQVPIYASRLNGYFMKVFAKTPNTALNYNGKFWKVLTQAGGMENSGYIYQRVDGTGNNVLSLSGDKPISATVFNPGQADDNVSTDPFQMDILPVEQYQKNVIFCTPGTKGGINFTRNYLGVIFQLDSNGSMPKDLEFGQSVNGKIKWMPLSAKFGPAVRTKDIFQEKVNGKTFAFKECTLGADGVYALRCSTPFMSYNYGGSDYDSYGHPTSGALTVVTTTPDTLQPVVTYEVACDGSVGVLKDAFATDLPNDSTCSNMSSITLVADSSYNYTLDYTPFEAGAPSAKTVKFKLTVDDITADAHALVVFTDRAGNQSCIEVNYIATKLSIDPTYWNYTKDTPAKIGEKRTKDFTIKNTGTSEVNVTKLNFKFGGAGVFDIIPSNPIPFKLKAGESKTITVQFTANGQQYVQDSIGLGDDCVFAYRAKVEARTGEPVIAVSDIDFGTHVLNSAPITKTFTVANMSNVRLTVHASTDILLDKGDPIPSGMFSTNVPFLTKNNPLQLDTATAPGKTDVMEYNVTFAPNALGEYFAMITFSSDASTIDSICYIHANINEPGLITNAVDFGRRRISGNKKYTGPYDIVRSDKMVQNQNNITGYIRLVNSGSAVATLQMPTSVPALATSKFQIEEPFSNINGRTIAPGDTLKFWIKYVPTNPAYDTIKISFPFEGGATPAEFTAVGVGVVPHVKIDSVDFGTVPLVNGVGNANKPFTITNLGATDWIFCDSLEITDFVDPSGLNKITDSYSTAVYGSENMAWDRTSVTFPMMLQPGVTTTPPFRAYFHPTSVNNKVGTIQTVSDAEVEAISEWKGNGSGDVLKYTMTVESKSICVGATDTLNVVITNTGVTNLGNPTLDGGKFHLQAGPNADIVLPADFTTPILCGQSSTFKIVFTPSSAGTQNFVLVCDATPGAPSVEVTANFSITGLTYPSRLYCEDIKTKLTVVGDVSTYFKFPIKLGQALDAANVHGLSFDVKFSHKDLLLKKDVDPTRAAISVNASGAASGFTAVAVPVANGDSTTVHITLTSPTNILKAGANAELVSLEFLVLLDVTYQSDFTSMVSIGNAKAYSDDQMKNQTCAIIEPSVTKITADPVCANSLVHVHAGLGSFMLKGISPNPVGTAGTRIDFGVGFDSPTRIDVVSSTGEIVATLVNETLKGGYYNLNFAPSDLSSGSYLVRMVSGGNTFTERMIVVK